MGGRERVTWAVTSMLASPLSPKGPDSQNSHLGEANGRPKRPQHRARDLRVSNHNTPPPSSSLLILR